MVKINKYNIKKRINNYWYDDDNSIYNHVLDTLNSVQDRKYYNILGYGSLLSLNSSLSTMPYCKDMGFVYLSGFKRVFNLGFDNAFLNIEKNSNYSIVCRKLKLNQSDFINYIIREGLYTLEFDNYHQSYYVINYKDTNNELEPDLNYIRTCISDLNQEQYENFMETSFTKGETIKQYIKKIFYE